MTYFSISYFESESNLYGFSLSQIDVCIPKDLEYYSPPFSAIIRFLLKHCELTDLTIIVKADEISYKEYSGPNEKLRTVPTSIVR